MEKIPCPDGYLLDPQSQIADGHHALNQYLLRVEEAGWQKALKEINATRDKAVKLLTWRALLERLRWLRDNNPSSFCLSPLRALAERIEKWTLSSNEADLIEIMDQTAEVAGFAAPYTPVQHLMVYVERNGLTPTLSSAIRDFRERVWEQSYTVNQVSLQLFRSRLDMLAWRDEWTEVDLKRCWSEQIRLDFRTMRGAERENWRRLLHSINGDEGTRPAPRWLSDVQTIVQAIGLQALCDRLMRWFEPLQRGCAQRLSREGSFLLRSFIWVVELVNNPELLARVGEICEVEFKPKSNGEKVIRAAVEAVGKAAPAKPAARAPKLDSLVVHALAAALSPENSLVWMELSDRIQIDDEIVHVRGDLDAYKVHISTGVIFRASDGKRVHIPAALSRLVASGVPEFAGVTELFSHIIILAKDAKHATALTATTE